ncbi:MAG: hypothetical protein IJE83_06540 [Oscillospiraceae bacterium]|nr:hypothetical protein [Oscillospiraceae bacterium]MBQ2862434.1 hypothetical protein [Oscillospiraceae bacterium]MBQ2998576.1 hypothetical protein [Oscillospiraceae bacterium]MBQ3236115.1 hypothetical protein [Oscillospiraceae bacterium]MBQ3560412.1 hypothetical protein [Oscillospiraceae bacterium]
MAENYARENTNKANNKNCKGCKNSVSSNAANNRSPLSKQNAAERKTQDCDR